MEVECMVTHPPGHGALLTGGAGLVGLALNAEVHDVVPEVGWIHLFTMKYVENLYIDKDCKYLLGRVVVKKNICETRSLSIDIEVQRHTCKQMQV